MTFHLFNIFWSKLPIPRIYIGDISIWIDYENANTAKYANIYPQLHRTIVKDWLNNLVEHIANRAWVLIKALLPILFCVQKPRHRRKGLNTAAGNNSSNVFKIP